ncbi:MAG: ABC transporter permease [Chloroflexi bacterium]|nr:ABC transporter permease [Chloroflexota bacterium]
MTQPLQPPTGPGALHDDLGAAPAPSASDYEVSLQSLSQWELAWRKFRQHKLALIGLGIMTVLILAAIVGPIFLPYAFDDIPRVDQNVYGGRPPFCAVYDNAKHVCTAFGLVHPMGETGGLQRDVLTLVLNGARVSLFLGFTSMAIGVIIGTIVGAIAGYIGGFIDNLLMRIVDVLLSLPLLFVILVVARFFQNSKDNVWAIIMIFGLFGWMGVSRLVRSLFLSIREREFVEAARAVGVRDRRIIFRHILPNALSPIVVVASLIIGGNIIGEAFISFLGFGVNPAVPTWGNILSNALTFILVGNWWWPLFPGVAIILTVLAVNFVGDGLRDAFDPRSRA